jgi:hypothetical protein
VAKIEYCTALPCLNVKCLFFVDSIQTGGFARKRVSILTALSSSFLRLIVALRSEDDGLPLENLVKLVRRLEGIP